MFTFMNRGIKGAAFDVQGRVVSQEIFFYALPSDQSLLPIAGLLYAISFYVDTCKVINPYCVFVLDQSWINTAPSTTAFSGLQHQIISYKRDDLFYTDVIPQSVLLQLRLLAYGISGYAASPLSLFFLISLVKGKEFKDFHISDKGLFFEDFYSFVACPQGGGVFDIEKNIDSDMYHFCILMHIIKRLWRWDE